MTSPERYRSPPVSTTFAQMRPALDGIEGRSTIVLALGKRAGVPLTAVDPFDDPYWGGGPQSLRHFEYLDGAHDYRSVSREIALRRRISPTAACCCATTRSRATASRAP